MAEKIENSGKIRRVKMSLKANDYRLLDDSIAKIKKVINKAGYDFLAGPLPMKTRSFKFTLNSSHHVYGKTKETYKFETYRRVIWISAETVDSLMTAQIPGSIDIKIEEEKSK